MTTRDSPIEIPVDGQRIPGTLVAPATAIPGVLFVQGWSSGQEQYLTRAREIAALGCVCLTFEPRGVARDHPEHETVTREENLRDVLAAYDLLAGQRAVDASAIGVVGSSYGGYLAAVLSSLRPVKWLALRVPALYKDEDWALPKRGLNKEELAAYRRSPVGAAENRALGACAAYEGDVLIVESEHDDVVPHPVIANYLAAFERAHSLTYRVIGGADHGLSEKPWQQAYTSLLVNWATEMVLGAREGGGASAAHTRLRPSRRGSPQPA
jgi:dienelactone hydrolase